MILPLHRFRTSTSSLLKNLPSHPSLTTSFHSTSTMTTPNVAYPTPETISAFLSATTRPYTPLPSPLTPSSARAWTPPSSPGAGGHRGRYLWTDAFGVINFITLSRICQPEYLILATRLAETVHSVLGRTRDGRSRLPGASEGDPLGGGLRIGKVEEGGSDGDGEYHHYLTLWMFALERLGRATGDAGWVRLAVGLGGAGNRLFVKRGGDGGLRMVWKVGVDGDVLVGSEGHLDAATGFVVYRLVARTAARFGMGDVLGKEIEEYRVLMSREGRLSPSHDVLDLGMGLWMAHFFREEPWAEKLGEQSIRIAKNVLRGVMARDARRRLAFREMGTCLGVECWGDVDGELRGLVEGIKRFWAERMEDGDEDLRAIGWVMYAAALVPGAWKNGFLEDD